LCVENTKTFDGGDVLADDILGVRAGLQEAFGVLCFERVDEAITLIGFGQAGLAYPEV
jgi:hypothetical protein